LGFFFFRRRDTRSRQNDFGRLSQKSLSGQDSSLPMRSV
jgi:hypothetical protein